MQNHDQSDVIMLNSVRTVSFGALAIFVIPLEGNFVKISILNLLCFQGK